MTKKTAEEPRPWDGLDEVKPNNLVNLRLSDRHKSMYIYIAENGGVRSGHSWLHAQLIPLLEVAAEKVYQAKMDGWKPPI